MKLFLVKGNTASILVASGICNSIYFLARKARIGFQGIRERILLFRKR